MTHSFSDVERDHAAGHAVAQAVALEPDRAAEPVAAGAGLVRVPSGAATTLIPMPATTAR